MAARLSTGFQSNMATLITWSVILLILRFQGEVHCEKSWTKVFPHCTNGSLLADLPNSFKIQPALIELLQLQNVSENFVITVLENRYKFKRPNLLIKALLHGSYKPALKKRLLDSFKPLDQVGTTVLDYLVGRHLIMNMDNLEPAAFNDLKAAVLQRNALAFIALKRNLDKFLLIDPKELNNDNLNKFREEIKNKKSYQEIVEEKPVAAKRAASGAFLHYQLKAVVGAIYVDSEYNIETTSTLVMPWLKEELDEVFNRNFHNKRIN